MFCIRSDVTTLGSIEMYGLVTVWTSMDDGPYWVILLMYGSHDMRHTGFCRLTVVNGTPGFWGDTAWYQSLGIRIPRARWGMGLGHYSFHDRVSGINKICFLCSSYCRS